MAHFYFGEIGGAAAQTKAGARPQKPGELYVHESGTPGMPAVVFLQGSVVSGRMWRDYMARLSGYHCLAPDLPGFGRSNRVPWVPAEQTADLVAELIQTRVPARRAHVVGLSWGGGIAHQLLARHPDLLDRVLIDSAGVLPWGWNGPFLAVIAAMTPFLHTRPVIALLSRAVGGFSEREKADIRMASRRAFRRSFFDGFRPRLARAELMAPCPTLFVAGGKEVAIRPSNAALAALMPNAIARFVPGTGHGWLGVKPGLHLAMVEAWIANEPLPEGLAVETTGWSKEAVERALRAGAAEKKRRLALRPAYPGA